MLRHRRAVEVRELTQRQSIGDAFAQLAIVPVLEPHQNQRAQNLRRRQPVIPEFGKSDSSRLPTGQAPAAKKHLNFNGISTTCAGASVRVNESTSPQFGITSHFNDSSS